MGAAHRRVPARPRRSLLFHEMTRGCQVEHPVTELGHPARPGELQLRVARGEPSADHAGRRADLEATPSKCASAPRSRRRILPAAARSRLAAERSPAATRARFRMVVSPHYRLESREADPHMARRVPRRSTAGAGAPIAPPCYGVPSNRAFLARILRHRRLRTAPRSPLLHWTPLPPESTARRSDAATWWLARAFRRRGARRALHPHTALATTEQRPPPAPCHGDCAGAHPVAREQRKRNAPRRRLTRARRTRSDRRDRHGAWHTVARASTTKPT